MSQAQTGRERTRRERTRRERGRRQCIGYITPRISNQHGLAIWHGMVEAAQLHNVDLVCFPGGEVQHPDAGTPTGKETARNTIYDLVDRASLDGLVVWGSSLGYYAGAEATYAFLKRFGPLPMVSIGVALPGIPGVVLDSYGGLRAALAHLIEVHDRRRIAFIRGPLTHREAGERYRSYYDTLAAYGIPFDAGLVSPPFLWVQADGAELETNGAEAIRVFLDERRLAIDAVVAASDTFALGAVPALQMRGIRVPEDVSVVGFDDRPASRILTPPLTTLKISMQERGQRALTMLLARLAGESVPDEVTLPAELVIRRSCGCFEPAVVRAGDRNRAPLTLAARNQGRTAAIFAASRAIAQECGATTELRQGQAVLDAFVAELEGGAASGFLTVLDSALRQTVAAGGDLGVWQALISVLRELLPAEVIERPEAPGQAETLWHQARVLIAERAWAAEADADRQAREQSDRLHSISRALTLAEDIPELMDVLARELPGLGIGSCAVALYENPATPTGACRLVLAYDEHERLNLPSEGAAWSAPVLASGGLLVDAAAEHVSPRSIIVEPLNCRDETLGFIMLEGCRGEGPVYHVLQEQIGSALKGVLLMQENVRLYRAALAAQEQAQEKQRLAEEADRLKSRFLSMVSHELRTPLILLEGLSEMMLREGLGSRPPLPDPYRQDLARISATAQQLGGLVRDVLDLARSQVGQLRLATRPVDIAVALQPMMLVGEQLARSKGLDWQVEIAPDTAGNLPEVAVDVARLQEVTLNLVSNAVKFTARGEVRLRIEAQDGVTVSVSDTGLGVPLDEQEAIFDEFRQSERTATRGFGGLGVGLAICRQIIHLHGGEIGVRSSGLEDGGSTFYYTLPACTLPALDPAAPRPGLAPSADASLDGRAQAVVLLTEHATGGELLRTHLLSQGFDVEVLAVEGQEDWLARLLARRPGAVVLDLQPAWAAGWELFEALKHSEATQGIPVLLYSLLAENGGCQDGVDHDGGRQEVAPNDCVDHDDADHARGVGGVLAFDYVSKPMGPAALAQALQNLGLAEHDAAQNHEADIILIADDDPAILELHAGIVRQRFPASRLLLAANGRQALAFLQAGERPRFVLLDLAMPELDGIGVIAALQADPRWRDIPVIVLTAQRLSDTDMEQLGRGVASILFKGMLTPAEALAQVGQALARNPRLGSETRRLARKVMAYIHTHYAEDLSREDLAGHVGISVRHLTRCFAFEVRMSPMDYLNRFRIAQARRLLNEGEANITQVMGAVGFADSSYFSRIFRREVGMSPSAYRNHAGSMSQSDHSKAQ